jgi:hypothetical protein
MGWGNPFGITPGMRRVNAVVGTTDAGQLVLSSAADSTAPPTGQVQPAPPGITVRDLLAGLEGGALRIVVRTGEGQVVPIIGISRRPPGGPTNPFWVLTPAGRPVTSRARHGDATRPSEA